MGEGYKCCIMFQFGFCCNLCNGVRLFYTICHNFDKFEKIACSILDSTKFSKTSRG